MSPTKSFSLLDKGQGSTSGDGLSMLENMMTMALELRGKQAGQTQAAPSAAAPGQATATAGVKSQPSMNSQIWQAPKIPGMPSKGTGAGTTGAGSMLAGSDVGGGVDSSNFSLGGGTSGGTGDVGSGIDSSNFSLNNDYGMLGGSPSSKDEQGDYSSLSALGDLAEMGMDIYGMTSMDEQEKLTRAQRNLLEQQYSIRQNWKDVYETYLLPYQAATKSYAYQKMGQNSDNYEYASDLLKGYLQGSSGVFAGQKEWDQVWEDISNISPEGEAPANLLESINNSYKNETVNPLMIDLTERTLEWIGKAYNIGVGLPKGTLGLLATEIARWGNAIIKGTLNWNKT